MANSTASKSPAPAPKTPRVEKTPAEKAAAFKKAANARGTRIVKSLASLRSIAKPGRYSWTPEQVAALFTRLEAEFSAAHSAFRNPTVTKSKEVINFV